MGYAVAAELVRRFAVDRPRSRFRGEVVEADAFGEKLLVLCPETYMNLSGASVVEARDFYKLPEQHVLVVCDDLHLPTGKLRCRAAGSSGGQKGLADIMRRLGTEQIPRLRVGIGSPPPGWDATDYVLGRFTADEQIEIEGAIERAAEAVIVWAREGIEQCMNRYN